MIVPILYTDVDSHLRDFVNDKIKLESATGIKDVVFYEPNGRLLGKFVEDDPNHLAIFVEATGETDYFSMWEKFIDFWHAHGGQKTIFNK